MSILLMRRIGWKPMPPARDRNAWSAVPSSSHSENFMTPIRSILTHPGAAHKDEFLACSLLLARHPVPIHRREPTPDDLNDPSLCVVDVGHLHDPDRHNFDHHHFPKDHAPTCSLSLVLQHLGLYQDARAFCDWLETTEWFDCRGPHSTAEWLGVERQILNQLNSPVDITLLRRFARTDLLKPGDPLWEVMRMIGEDLVDHLKSLRSRLDFLRDHAEIWTLQLPDGPAKILFLPRTDPLPDEPSRGLDLFLQSQGLDRETVALVYPDRRGSGYGLSRHNDTTRVDFTRIAGHPEVHFAHARGFVAKTTTTAIPNLQALLLQASRPAGN